MWYVVYLTEETKLSYTDVMDMPMNLMMDYFRQKQCLFKKVEREEIDSTNINSFRMTKEEEEMWERGELK